MKKVKKMLSVLITLVIVINLFSYQSISLSAVENNNLDSVSSSDAKESIVYLSNGQYIDVANFGNIEYVNIDTKKSIFYKVAIDSEIYQGSTFTLQIKVVDTGRVITSRTPSMRSDYYTLDQYIPLDLSEYSGKLEISTWFVLANGQVVYDDKPVKLYAFAKIASGKCGDNLTWELHNDGILDISGYGEMYNFNRFTADLGTDDKIPWKDYRQSIKIVNINSGVTSIGTQAFYGVSPYGANSNKIDSIEKINISNTVKQIGDSAFSGCNNVQSIVVPDSVETLGTGVFFNCSSLESITLSQKLTELPKETFIFCKRLSSVDIPKSIKRIGMSALEYTGLENIVIPSTVESIGYCAFCWNENLKTVKVMGDVILDGDVFSDCDNLYSVEFYGSITQQSNSSNYGRWFKDSKKLSALTIPSVFYFNSEEYPIQSYANFNGCDSLNFKNITFTDNVKIVDGVLFSNDKKTLLWYPETLTNSNYVIPDGTEKLASYSFQNNKNLTHIIIPESVKELRGHVFYYCSNLNNVIIPNGITSLFDFQACTSLKNIVVPASVTVMYQRGKESVETFGGCSDLNIYCEKNSFAEEFANAFEGLFTAKEIVYCNFDANGGINDYDKQPVIPGDKYWLLPTPTRNNYKFDGWYTSRTGGSKVTTDSIVYSNTNYTLYAHWTSNITTKSISNTSITLSASSYTYDGTAKKPTVTVKDGTTTLVNGTDYSVTYSNNTNVGTATVTVTGKGGYSGTVTKNFTIGAKSISSAIITLSAASYTYDGTAKKPTVTVKDGTTTLVNGSDYSVTYSNNTNVGTATVTITGKGNYSGTVTKNFTIGAKSISSATVTLSATSYTYDGTAKTPTVTVKDGTTTLVKDTDYTVSYSNNTNVGTATVTITGKDKYSGTVTKNFTIGSKSITSATVTLSDASYTYDGTAKKPTVTVKDGTTTLVKDTDYTVSYSNNTNVGTATVTITGKGKYSGTVTKNFTIVPAKKEFNWGQDNWRFDNTSQYFANYNVNSTVMNLMKADFGMSNLDIYELQEAISEDNYYGFGGSCFGMTVSEILAKQGSLKLSRYGGNDIVHNNTNTSNMTSVINFIQELQSVSRCSQIIRQSPFMSGNYSQYDFIDKAESVLGNENTLVKLSYEICKLNTDSGQYSSAGYHAVLAYGVENYTYYSPVTGKTYDKRILIADPNYLSEDKVYNDACIYYKSSDHSWICPYWYRKTSSYTQMCYWNANTSIGTKTGIIRNLMKYNSLTDTVDLMADYSVNHYISGLTVDNESGNYSYVEQVEKSGNPNMDYAGDLGTGIARYDIEMDDSFSVKETEEFYALWNPTANYTLSYSKPSDFKVKMDYDDIVYYADLSDATYMTFKPNGTVSFRGANSDYSVKIVTNDSECVTNWYVLTVSGEKTDDFSYMKTKNGYILSSDNLHNISIGALNDTVNITRSFSTDYDSVFIYEIDENHIGVKVDTDNNGTYETELPIDNPNDFEDKGILGDVDLDGKVTINDATVIQRYLAKMVNLNAERRKLGDANNNGKIDINDATMIQRYLAELIIIFPVGSMI